MQGLMVGWGKNYNDLQLLTQPKKSPTQLTVIESAHSDGGKIRPRVQLNIILGGAIGLIVALALAFVLGFLDDTYKSLNDFSQSEELNILGSIRGIKGKKLPDKLIAHLHPHSPITESYRIIRSRIRIKPADKPTVSIMVASPMPDEGKSVTAANLAVVFAQANYKTIVVDANLRHPVLHQVFNMNNEVGLGDMLDSPELPIEECLKSTPIKNLQILTSGTPLPDPSERLGSGRMAEILVGLKNNAEIVIFDSPPVLVYADATVLSRRMDGLILVIRAGKSGRGAVNQTIFDLQNTSADLLGIIFNHSPKSDTFSVNKAYMQQRPQLSSPTILTKKASVIESQFSDLRDSAVPLKENIEISGLEGEVEFEEENAGHEDARITNESHHRKRSRKHKSHQSESHELKGEGVSLELTNVPVDLNHD